MKETKGGQRACLIQGWRRKGERRRRRMRIGEGRRESGEVRGEEDEEDEEEGRKEVKVEEGKKQ